MVQGLTKTHLLWPTQSCITKQEMQIDLSALKTLALIRRPKPADTFFQRLWKVLPPRSYALCRAISLVFPFYRYFSYWNESLSAIGLLQKLQVEKNDLTFTSEEKVTLSRFFQKVIENPSCLSSLRAFASAEQYKLILFVQGILNTTDVSLLDQKLDTMERFLKGKSSLSEISPLSVDEIGIIQFSEARSEFLCALQGKGIKEIDQLSFFWSQMAERRNHTAIQALCDKTLSLFSEGALGFVTGREESSQGFFNLKEDSLQGLHCLSLIHYLSIGTSCHVGFFFEKEGALWSSHINGRYRHEVSPHKIGILRPSQHVFRFKIKQLLSSEVKPVHAEFLEKFFAKKLTEMVSVPKDVRMVGAKEAIEAFCFGTRTPFWSRKEVEQIQPKEFCTGMTAKTVYHTFLKVQEELVALGYSKDVMENPFQANDHIGRMVIADFMKYFKDRKMIEWVDDPFVKACIESGAVESELSFME